MKLLYSCCFFTMLIASPAMLAQHSLGAKAAGGISRIPYETEPYETGPYEFSYGIQPKRTHTTYWAPSWNVGLYYCWDISKRSGIGVEMLFNRIQSEEKAIIENGRKIERITTYRSYITVPIYYRLTFGNLAFTAGMQVSNLLQEKEKFVGHSTSEDGTTTWQGESNSTNYDLNDFGGHIGIAYAIGRMSVFAYYYHGMNNISPRTSSTTRRIRQATLGIGYVFLKTKKEEKE